VIQQNDRRSRN